MLVTETFPQLNINKFELMGNGKAAIICLANDEIVFKIPLQKDGEIARWQKNEAEVLNFLEGKLDIEIPKLLYAATAKNGLFIIGETLLSGTTLTYELCDTYSSETKNNLLRQLGKIVRNLHDAGGSDSSWLDEGHQDTIDDYMNEFYMRLSGETRSVFTNSEIKKLEEIAERYKKISATHPVKPVLCHHDLHFFNLMFDTESKQITGLLDFGCAGYAEPARDWHYYFDAKHILEGYGNNGDKYFSRRLKFHALSWLLSNLGESLTNKQETEKNLGFIRDYILNE
jgi:aminoglycoside 2''-phosphotransferase